MSDNPATAARIIQDTKQQITRIRKREMCDLVYINQLAARGILNSKTLKPMLDHMRLPPHPSRKKWKI